MGTNFDNIVIEISDLKAKMVALNAFCCIHFRPLGINFRRERERSIGRFNTYVVQRNLTTVIEETERVKLTA